MSLQNNWLRSRIKAEQKYGNKYDCIFYSVAEITVLLFRRANYRAFNVKLACVL